MENGASFYCNFTPEPSQVPSHAHEAKVSRDVRCFASSAERPGSGSPTTTAQPSPLNRMLGSGLLLIKAAPIGP